MSVPLEDPSALLPAEGARLDALVELRDVFKIYDEEGQQTVALRGANLTVHPGERVAILGPSGSGKSTLLSLAAGLSAPSAGAILLAGRSLADMPEDVRARARQSGLGLVFQRDNLVPFLTARENVELAMAVNGDRRQRALQLLRRVGLGDRVEHTPARLSGGEQQRAALAVALANDPALLLADELTGELDSETAADVMRLLADLNRERGLAVVVVTHNPAVAADADRVLRMMNGVLTPINVEVGVADNPPPSSAQVKGVEVGPAVLEATNLVKTYPGGVQALRGVSLAVSAGETLAVVGPSGCGKSTLLNLLGSLDRPTSGSLTLAGRSLTAVDAASLAVLRRREIGFIFQAHNLVASLTAAENVALPLVLDGIPEAEWRPRAEALLAAVALGPAVEKLPDQLSGGERQRVAIARALAHQPRVVLADEPTGSLDSDTAEQVTQLLIDLAHVERLALIVVTHDPRVAAACERVLPLRDGLEVRDGAR
jgi:ABC-type lipoprotein export system ATPase subunit